MQIIDIGNVIITYVPLISFLTFIILILNSFTPLTEWVKRRILYCFRKIKMDRYKRNFQKKIIKNNMPHIYLLNIDGVAHHWIHDPSVVRQHIINLLNKLNYDNNKIHNINNLDEWNLIVTQPPENIIIINCHGETLPIPIQAVNEWRIFYRRIANNIHNLKWIFVSLTGYPLFTYACDEITHETDGELGLQGENGINEILSIIHANINCREQSYITITKDGNRALKNIDSNIHSLLRAERSALLHINAYRIFYSGQINDGVLAIKIGNGFFIHNGIAYMNLGSYDQPRDITDNILADMGIAFALDLVCFPTIEK